MNATHALRNIRAARREQKRRDDRAAFWAREGRISARQHGTPT